MDYSVPEELAEFVEAVRRFREKELSPLEGEFLRAGKLGAAERGDLELRARELGFWALDVPVEYGGQGLGELGMCLISEELYKHPAMFDFGGSPEPALYFCTEEQKKEYFFPVIDGTRRSCYAFTEPGTGSDLSAIATRAVLDGDEYVITGSKMFISHADRADFVILFATVDPTAGARGVTAFLVDYDSPGFKVSRAIPTMGDDWEPYELTFDSCRIPVENRLGDAGQGWQIADHQLTHGRLKIAAYNLGIAQRSLDIAIDWAKERTTWGKPIASRQAIQWMIADSAVEFEAARQLVYRAAWLRDQGNEGRFESLAAKLYATEMAQRVTDRCLQILGGYGYSKEVPIQSFFRQVRLWRIGHGTSEIHRWVIARELLGSAAKD